MLARSGETPEPCPVPPLTDGHDPVFHDARLEPFADQADDTPVADPMLQEPDEPFLVHLVEERLDIGVQYEAHLLAVDFDVERVQCVVRAAPQAGIRTRTRESLPRRSRSAVRLPPVGRSCPPGQRPRAGVVGHLAWVCTLAGLAAPDTLRFGPGCANLRDCAQGLPRSPSTSAGPHPVPRPP